MKFSFSWLKDYLETDLSADEIGDVLTDTGLEVESLIDPRKRLGQLSVGEILKVEKHPNADKLKVCEVDSSTGILKIVCGAPNVKNLKIKKAKTDQYPIPDNIDDLNNRPEALNLINIYASFSNKSVKEILQQFSGKGFAQFKESLSDLIINDISPITKEMKHLMNNKDEIIKILIDGSSKAQEIANEVLIDIKKIIGINFKD